VRCWVTPRPAPDFSGHSDVRCQTTAPSPDSPLTPVNVSVNVLGTGFAAGASVDSGEPVMVGTARLPNYPLTVKVDATFDSRVAGMTGALSSELVTFTTSTKIETPTSVPEAAPYQVTLPFEIWSVTIQGQADIFTSKLEPYALELSPLLVGDQPTLTLDRNLNVMVTKVDAAKTVFFAVAPGTTRLAGTGEFTKKRTLTQPGETKTLEIVFEPDGVYRARMDGLLRVEPEPRDGPPVVVGKPSPESDGKTSAPEPTQFRNDLAGCHDPGTASRISCARAARRAGIR
jgi:hypothetical protein